MVWVVKRKWFDGWQYLSDNPIGLIAASNREAGWTIHPKQAHPFMTMHEARWAAKNLSGKVYRRRPKQPPPAVSAERLAALEFLAAEARTMTVRGTHVPWIKKALAKLDAIDAKEAGRQ